jgi:signal transduction histidine kinase/ActR/RegA family two-component response regulator
MKDETQSFYNRIFAWSDRHLSSEVKRDPDRHLRVQIGLFTTFFGALIGCGLIAYAVPLSEDPTNLYPYVAGLLLSCLCGLSMLKSKSATLGLEGITVLIVGMTILSTYNSGGFNNAAVTLFPTIPVYLATFTRTRMLVVGTAIAITALFIFWYLHHIGHTFPVIVEQTPALWALVTSWAVLNAAGLAYFTQNRFRKAFAIYQQEIQRRTKVEQSLRHAQQRLRIAKGAAEAGSQAKGAFLAQVSHEIRNPLTAIMGTIDLLELPADPAVREARLDMLRRSATSLLELVDDVLDYSKMEAERIEINSKAIDPVIVIEEIERSYRPQALEKNLDLLLEIDPEIPKEIIGDPLRIRQVLVNLISNALKFTPEGSITIELWKDTFEDGREGIVFGVEDTGIGVPEDAHSQIFEPYGQAERSTTEKYGGTGLGLPICSRLVSLMGGQFGFETTEGVGTRFWFILPIKAKIETADIQPVDSSESLGRTRVLVVEDDPLNRQVVGELLASLGHHVSLASCGVEGINSYKSEQPDLVLMDIRMPDINGMDASRMIRAWEVEQQLPKVPILAMTADVELHRVAHYGEAGMNDLLGKPINREKLEQAVRGWAIRHHSTTKSPH